MIRSCFLFLCLALAGQVSAQKGDILFSGDFREVPFDHFVKDIERQKQVHFYYLQEWTSELVISASGQNISLSEILQQFLPAVELSYHIDDNRNVYISPENLATSLERPSDSLPSMSGTQNNQHSIDTYQKYFGVKRAEITETVRIGTSGEGNGNEHVSLYGKITDVSSGEARIGATVYIEETRTGTVTDIDGRYRIVLAPGNYTIRINCLGMKEITYNLEIYEDGNLDVSMESEIIPINEVVIRADRYQNVRGMQMGFVKLDTKKIKEIPMVLGERDLLKVAQMLPGIQTVGEGSSGFNVRGSAADQNMFYINKMPVYNTSHLFGFFSAFNPDIIKDFTLYKSNVPVEFGGRLASIFNISTREGNKNRLTGRGGITPITGHMAIEGPLKQEKHSFVLSARTTYSDWLLKRIPDPDIRRSSAAFYDLAGSVNLEPNDRNLVKIFGYYTSDRFSLVDLVQYDYSNRGGSLDWRHRITPSLSSEFSTAFTNYSFSTANLEDPISAYRHEYLIGHYEATGHFSWVPHPKHVVTFGGNLIYYHLERGQITPHGAESIRRPAKLGNQDALETALYIGDKYQLFPRITLYGGIRFGTYGLLGPEKVYQYVAEAPKTDVSISDTVSFSPWKFVKLYSGPELRTAVNINTGENSSLKLSYNRLKQYLFLLSNTIAISPTDQWKLCDYHIRPPYADQVSAGYYKDFPRQGLRTSLETYYKKVNDIVEYKDGADFIASPNIEQEVLQGIQDAYGIEMMIERRAGRLNGWVSYTYSGSRVTVDGRYSWDKINYGLSYPSNYDKPHAFNLVLNYRWNRRVSMSGNMVYSTGRPVTYPVSVYYMNGQKTIQYSERNAYRIPDYFRVDLSFNMEGNLKAKKWLHSYWMLNFYNLTGRNNAYSVYFRSEDGTLNGYKLSIFGNMMVTISWNFKFGNYASE